MANIRTKIRMCEWSAVARIGLTSQQRRSIAEMAKTWQESNGLPDLPLWFSGPDAETLNSGHYVGVIELADTVIEIFPKLDRHLLGRDTVEDDQIVGSVMSDLLWVLDVSGHLGISEIDKAGLKESPTSFYDIFALLLAKNLLFELSAGVPHKYLTVNDNIRKVRGKICILEQITRNLNRLDMISCEWDEFTPDIPMNKLIKCSCRFLQSRVTAGSASRALVDCITQYDEISDVDPYTALNEVIGHRWDRTTERFRPVFDLAKRLLQGVGHLLSSSDTTTFVFLLDMNKVFEEYVKALLAACFNVGIESQKNVGHLFPKLSKGRVQQRADYFWRTNDGTFWVGDAKYKHLTKDQTCSLMFTQIQEEDAHDSSLAGRILQPNDIRQLTVYAELVRKKRDILVPPNILLLYPYVGDVDANIDTAESWNGSTFTLCPVSMHKHDNLKSALPYELWQQSGNLKKMLA